MTEEKDTGVALVGPLDQAAVEKLWGVASEMLIPALEREGWKIKPDQVLKQISEGLMGLYVVQDFISGEVLAALICEAQEYPNAQVFCVSYLGGKDVHRWSHLIADVEMEALRLGCHIVRIPGRKGWGQIFPTYREVYRVFEREVTA